MQAEMNPSQFEITMDSVEERETKGLKFCYVCRAEARKTTDKFCRRCGARQIFDTAQFNLNRQEPAVPAHTESLSTAVQLRQLSGPLVRVVTEEISAQASTKLKSPYSKGLFLAVLSILIWLLMVLLSPIDALIAARGITHHSF
jgi:hypothetical protein